MELVVGGDSAISVLRAFRLMRVFKIFKAFPGLQRQMAVLTSSLPDVGNFSILLIMFAFMYAILGMYLFGDKLKFPADEECTLDCEMVDDRTNFNNLYWSFITVFQLLTIEDFPGVMISAVRSQVSPLS